MVEHPNCRCVPTLLTRQYHEFHLEHPATVADIQDLLRKLDARGVHPGFVVVSRDDYQAIQEEIVGPRFDPMLLQGATLKIYDVRIIAMPTLESGDVVFGSMESTEKSSTPRVFRFPIL